MGSYPGLGLGVEELRSRHGKKCWAGRSWRSGCLGGMQTVAAVGMMEGKLVVGRELFFVGFPVGQVVIWQRQAATGAAAKEELGPQWMFCVPNYVAAGQASALC